MQRRTWAFSFVMFVACGDDAKSTGDTTESVDTSVAADTDSATDASEPVDSATAPSDTSDSSTPDVEVEVVEGASFTLVELGLPVDLTPDGTYAIFWDNASENGDVHLYDTEFGTHGLETSTGSPLRDFPTGVSSNIEITANYDEPVKAGVWTSDKAWRDLGNIYNEGCGLSVDDPKAGDVASAWDISADGKVVVGLAWNGCHPSAFRWSDGEPADFRALEVLGAVGESQEGPPTNRATVVSDDGKVAAGFAQTALVDRWPAVWDTDTAEGYLIETTVFSADSPGEILAITGEGAVAVGVWGLHAFRWAKDGVIDLGAITPGDNAYANAVASGGSLVFGTSQALFDTGHAFVWDEFHGMRKLADVITAHGLVIPADHQLTNVLASSTDGSVLIGSVMNTSTFIETSFVLRLPASVYFE